jgi:two-component system chemotaxis sensor kinase CheA
LDHGIELPEERVLKGKNKQGQINLKAFYSGANVIIQISDDGAGMDYEKIRQKAISKKIITPDAVLNQKELLELVFLPGFTTATNITDVSGRGVGMDIVKKKISDIRGEVELESKVNVGTTITIKLPLTLSIIDGLLVKIVDVNYIIPLSLVQKVYAIEHKEISNLFNNIIELDGVQIPFFYLRTEFELPVNEELIEEIVIVKYEDKQVGFVVDSVIGEYQAVLKPLGKHYKKQPIVSSATILGDGTVALVMDSNKAIRSFSHQSKIKEETL